MTENIPLPLAALNSNLQRLCWIRAIVIVFLSLSTIYAWLQLDLGLRLSVIIATVAVFALATLVTYYRVVRGAQIDEREYFFQLSFDVVLLACLLYLTGGATNPFVSYFLVPLCIAAATLPWVYSLVIAALSVVLYSLLLFYFMPLAFFSQAGAGHHPGETVFNAHYLGMWFNFFVSAALIAWFVARMAESLREQEEEINAIRERQLQDEQIVAIASLSAGTAHELGTPINSMKLILEELEYSEPALGNSARADIELMRSQIAVCESSLKNLVTTARQTDMSESRQQAVGDWLLDCIAQWQPLRPEALVEIRFDQKDFKSEIHFDATLQQALANLLDNAATASPDSVAVDLQYIDRAGKRFAEITICDRGTGFDPALRQQLGVVVQRQTDDGKSQGLGIGVYLSNASINRFGGELRLNNRYDTAETVSGADVKVILPVVNVK